MNPLAAIRPFRCVVKKKKGERKEKESEHDNK